MDQELNALVAGLSQKGGKVLTATQDCVEVDFGDSLIRTVYLDNLRRRVKAGHSLTQAVEEFAAAAAKRTLEPTDTATFRAGLRWSVERKEIAEGSTLRRDISKQVVLVLAWTDPDERHVQFVDQKHLAQWGLTEGEAWAEAGRHMSKLASDTETEVKEVAGTKVVFLSTRSIFKASLVTSPNLRERVQAQIGWPINAVIPCRDFVYLFPDKSDGLLQKLGGVVTKEFKDSPYPLSTEVFAISDAGLKALGAF